MSLIKDLHSKLFTLVVAVILTSCYSGRNVTLHSLSRAHPTGVAEWCGYGTVGNVVRFVVFARASGQVKVPVVWKESDGSATLGLPSGEIDLVRIGGVYEIVDGKLYAKSIDSPSLDQLDRYIQSEGLVWTIKGLSAAK